MTQESDSFCKGDAVRVKQGVMCPDFKGLSIAGWQGRITDIERGENDEVVCIKWDSITLSAMPKMYLADSEAQGCDCMLMWLDMAEVESVLARDSEVEAERMERVLESRSMWLGMGESGERILAVIGNTDPDDPWETLEAWREHLAKTLSFPFNACVAEFQEGGPINEGDAVNVLSIEGVDELMGVMVKVKRGWRKRVFPLCDLEAVPRTSTAYAQVKDYCTWFANH